VSGAALLVLSSVFELDTVPARVFGAEDNRPEVIALQPPIAFVSAQAMAMPPREPPAASKLPAVKPLTGSATPLLPAEARGVYTLPSPGARLTYVANSSVRIEQVVGDSDRSNNKPTVNLTQKRYGIEGTDLGVSFEHKGKLYFLFGDTIGPVGGDAIGVSESTDPNLPLQLDFLMDDATGHYLVVEPPAISMEGYETPVSGISVNGQMYVVIKSAYMPPWSENVATMLTRYDEPTQTFRVQRWISSLPGGRFITPSLHLIEGPVANLEGSGPWVMMFGSGDYRNSMGYLGITPAATFATGEGTRYFAGFGTQGPIWSAREADAMPIIDQKDVGDISVTYVKEISLWVALYDSLDPRGILMRYAAHPWGPWSEEEIIYEPSRETGYGVFIYDPTRKDNDKLHGPFNDPDNKQETSYGGFYAPYVIERFTRAGNGEVSLHWLMSTWNPYVVVRMESRFKVLAPEKAPEPQPVRTADLPAGYLIDP
jgi:hypothetical protein